MLKKFLIAGIFFSIIILLYKLVIIPGNYSKTITGLCFLIAALLTMLMSRFLYKKDELK